jgi:hypothetical protein
MTNCARISEGCPDSHSFSSLEVLSVPNETIRRTIRAVVLLLVLLEFQEAGKLDVVYCVLIR